MGLALTDNRALHHFKAFVFEAVVVENARKAIPEAYDMFHDRRAADGVAPVPASGRQFGLLRC
jgi:hypothetical protein